MTAATGLAAAAVWVAYPASAALASPSDAAALAAQLGDRSGGTYLDSASGRMVVTVTDGAAATRVRSAGAVPRRVAYGRAQFDQATSALTTAARIPGTSWAVDPVTDQVVVTYDNAVTGARLDQLKSVVARLGGVARLESATGTLSTRIAGGDAIFGLEFECSLGFNVHSSSGTSYFLTAGHCGNDEATWYANQSDSTLLGNTVESTFPDSDYAIVRYTNSGVSHPGAVGSQSITSAATPSVGQSVTRRGARSGTHSGRVTALNSTVNYDDGSTVFGLIQTSVCAEPGDSGGPLYSGSTAYGLTSGGSGDCTSGGTTYFQPVTEALSAYGVTIS